MAEIRLDLLNPVDLIEQKTTDEILKEIGGDSVSPSNPEGRVYHGWAFRESMRRKSEDSNARNMLLAFSKGATLDFIGETYYRNSDGSQILRKPGESDDSYRLALQESPEGLTSAGTLKSYDFHAGRAHEFLSRENVRSYSPSPMVMNTYFISNDENAAEIKTAIENYLIPYVPGGDLFTAIQATKVTGTITGVVKCDTGVGLELVKSQGLAALSAYLAESERIRGIISDSSVKDAVTVPGVRQIILTDWLDLDCSFSEYPEITDINLVYEVRK